ncbi:hypothetical protein HSR122_2355 [Halapricum desulfuricans]|uniref:DUF7978 domain-containing protein n=2 Tax=Halapricum desulfuricans TaxID=2841257 RepID=A0A897NAI8_9EURY|nr:hypothetical protein HSR122_2355 [Halapricum desulfuricans]
MGSSGTVVLSICMWRDRLAATSHPGDSLRHGFLAGVGAGALAFALTALVRLFEIARSTAGFRLYLRPDGLDGTLVVLGGTFYGAHPGAYDAPVWLRVVLQRYDTLPEVVYVATVASVLAATGWWLAARFESETIDGAVRGATVTVGYAPAVVLGAFVFEMLVDLGPMTVFLDQLLPIALASALVPAVAGAVGGLLAAWLHR